MTFFDTNPQSIPTLVFPFLVVLLKYTPLDNSHQVYEAAPSQARVSIA